MTLYENRIRSRNIFRFTLGLIPRIWLFLKFGLWRRIAILRGATIGKYTVIPPRLAWKANRNLVVGSHCSIGSSDLDLRSTLVIGNHVIINSGVKIILASHDFNSSEFETYYVQLEISDYAWLATNSLILPKVGRIGYGAICGSGSVVTKAVGNMEIVGGNPAKVLGQRKCVHDKVPLESMRGYDLIQYVKTYITKNTCSPV